ncbi:phage terminase small subunit P27 family [Neobacillus sedimentimangrovi]|jgi:P27 family predicted phage terminase small subunit|uniref:Phage terminase small subunit P27 family n=1 Tax=Neobacillus sedimentimangrovi TaxID=2699460 RepID=A0ABS8QGR1_9BACI|nr:phage terminase small subunit P27 family [Neobacillus sedimentimangrovi]MCD4838160.1 phage terminase small subunit P27 family [Neobacillus sedimentimangrovi]
MARPRQPIDLLLYKGKKNLTKKEIEERKSTEVKAASDKVKAPTYLPKELKKEFKKIADELLSIGIITNLDVDALARFLIAKKLYLEITQMLLDDPNLLLDKDVVGTQDKLFKQSRAAASDLGLTISSRCKLVIPKKEEKPPQTEAERRFGDRV